MLKTALIGFGGIAHSAHLKPLLTLEEKGVLQLSAVSDICPERFSGTIEINVGGTNAVLGDSVKKYTDWREMLEKEDIDMVDICVPTYLHAEITIGALEAGCHVLCEKPMSLTYETALSMCEAAKRTGKKLMIGQCVRFLASMGVIKKLIDDGTYGKVKAAEFHRLSGPPKWGWDNWFMDYSRSKGCILDMHIHDIDFIRYALGDPERVSCCTADFYSGRDVVQSRLLYRDFSVLAVGDWSREGLPFKEDCTISFEHATVIYDGNDVTIAPRGGKPFAAEFEPNNQYQAEIEYFADCIINNRDITVSTPESAALSVKLVGALMESADNNGAFVPYSAN